jgi:P4 family phage/plasmid primase-like protien
VHQILGLRPFFNEKKGIWDKTDNTFFRRGWRFPSIPDLFANLEKYLAPIPEAERWNLYYTVAFCAEGKREFREQHVIIFDIDKVDRPEGEGLPQPGAYQSVVCNALGLDSSKTGLVASGHGFHFIIGLEHPFADPTIFESQKRHYLACCDKIDSALAKAGLPGKTDRGVFEARRIMRLPGTENRKEGMPGVPCRLLQGVVTPVAFDLALASGLPKIEAKDQINVQAAKKLPTPDTKAILDGCDFLKWCKESPNEVSEAQWYAMLSIIPRLPPKGRELAHDYSSGHRSYSASETEAKIDQALAASGPRTCDNIDKLWGKCSTCPHFGKTPSPIAIQGENYIKTRDTGFHNTYVNKDNIVCVGKPNYEDLRRFFNEEQGPYIVLGESGICLTWNGKHWEEYNDLYLQNFAQTNFNPTATGQMVAEFSGLVCRTNLKPTDWFTKTTQGKLNFQNGILDLKTLQLLPHSPEFGFRNVVSYPYDPDAKAPNFEKFLLDIMDGRKPLADVLMEFAGYAFSNDICWAQVALILSGDGSNGKSTFMDILKDLAGDDNYSALTLSDLKSETARKMLDGKLFNLAEETPTYAMTESSIFKNLVGGGETTVKQLYKQPYRIKNKAKMMFACNELPRTKDTTRGYFRRLVIVPFDRRFEGAAKDPFIKDKLMGELPGIYNLVIDGYRRLVKRRRFSEADEIAKEIEKYREDLDTVLSWYKDCIEDNLEPVLNAKHEAPLSKLYSSYRFYCEARGEKPETHPTFSRRLGHILPDHKARWRRVSIKGKREVAFAGVKYADGTDY